MNYIDGSPVMPILDMKHDNSAKAMSDHKQHLQDWYMTKRKIITWINNAITQGIGFQLLKFSAKTAWDFLVNLYMHYNYDKKISITITNTSCLPRCLFYSRFLYQVTYVVGSIRTFGAN